MTAVGQEPSTTERVSGRNLRRKEKKSFANSLRNFPREVDEAVTNYGTAHARRSGYGGRGMESEASSNIDRATPGGSSRLREHLRRVGRRRAGSE